MKLLFCEVCFDVFKLDFELRACICGRVKGKYLPDGTYAVVNGKGFSLAIGNGSLTKATTALSGPDSAKYPKKRDPYHPPTVIIAWARPHEGLANPHTKVDQQLGESGDES